MLHCYVNAVLVMNLCSRDLLVTSLCVQPMKCLSMVQHQLDICQVGLKQIIGNKLGVHVYIIINQNVMNYYDFDMNTINEIVYYW